MKLPNRFILSLCAFVLAGFALPVFAAGKEVALPAPADEIRINLPSPPKAKSGAAGSFTSEFTTRFIGSAFADTGSLLLHQTGVEEAWEVWLNNQLLGELPVWAQPLTARLEIPGGTLRDGTNTLMFRCATAPARAVRLADVRIRKLDAVKIATESLVEVKVTDAASGKPLPSRLTILDETGALALVMASSEKPSASRQGTVYIPQGEIVLGLPLGRYTIYASRGQAYTSVSTNILTATGQRTKIELALKRDPALDAWLAVDPHLHTLTTSLEGDVNIEERLISVAGEGVTLAVATEHNQGSRWGEIASAAGVGDLFTLGNGIGITAKEGQFNVFPLAYDTVVPSLTNLLWAPIDDATKKLPMARLRVLAHPHYSKEWLPIFHRSSFNPVSGRFADGRAHWYEGLEVLTAAHLGTNWMQGVEDWFAVLNAGGHPVALGASGSSDLARVPAGLARTYVKVRANDPAKVSTPVVCDAILAGHAVASMGLFADIHVDDQFGPGDLMTPKGDSLKVRVEVSGPNWAKLEAIELYGNGIKLKEQKVAANNKRDASGFIHESAAWEIPMPRGDVFLVAVARGSAVDAPFWTTTIPAGLPVTWRPPVAAITNPIWIDADRDKQFTSARAYAQKIVKMTGKDLVTTVISMREQDEAAGVQAAAELASLGVDLRSSEMAGALKAATAEIRRGIQKYIGTLR